jgi:hypothetical protein
MANVLHLLAFISGCAVVPFLLQASVLRIRDWPRVLKRGSLGVGSEIASGDDSDKVHHLSE